MNENLDFITYLRISPKKIGIYLFDTKNLKNLYLQEAENKTNEDNFESLNKFLEENIFKIEKLISKFIENIFLIVDSNSVLNLEIGIKKKNYEKNINKNFLKNMVVDAKDLFDENYQNEKIMHIVINNFIIDGKHFKLLQNDIRADTFCIIVQFKSIPKSIVYNMEKILEKYHIKINKFLDGQYIDFFLKTNDFEFCEMTYKILCGHNENEIELVPKNVKKKGFFEKFFQFFG